MDCLGIGGRHDTALAREKALELDLPCSEIVPGTTNGYTSFLIAPDGSKEGWAESTQQEAKRMEWIAWVRNECRCLDWAYISFGGDNAELAHIEDHNGADPANADHA